MSGGMGPGKQVELEQARLLYGWWWGSSECRGYEDVLTVERIHFSSQEPFYEEWFKNYLNSSLLVPCTQTAQVYFSASALSARHPFLAPHSC